MLYLEVSSFPSTTILQKRDRKPNIHRKRVDRLEEIRLFSNSWFKKCYRMSREDFNDLLIKITPILETKYPKMAKISSGSPLNAELLELLGLG